MNIAENIKTLREEIPGRVSIIAVSKTMPVERIREAYEAGQRIFGENRVQELVEKQPLLPEDVEWHFIGHLQTNKVKLVVPTTSLIHSVDSKRLLQSIDREGQRLGRKVGCLLQLKIAREETKHGLKRDEATELLKACLQDHYRFVSVRGLMGMATLTGDMDQVAGEFAYLADFFRELKHGMLAHDESFRELSMGMSGDFRIAVKEGSTMVRIGSLIFGDRNHDQ